MAAVHFITVANLTEHLEHKDSSMFFHVCRCAKDIL